jgi:hypothetical protein
MRPAIDLAQPTTSTTPRERRRCGPPFRPHPTTAAGLTAALEPPSRFGGHGRPQTLEPQPEGPRSLPPSAAPAHNPPELEKKRERYFLLCILFVLKEVTLC